MEELGAGTLEMCSEDVLRRKDWDSPANMDQFLIGDGSAHWPGIIPTCSFQQFPLAHPAFTPFPHSDLWQLLTQLTFPPENTFPWPP